MSLTPIITFKAGQCTSSDSGPDFKITCNPTPGYLYLYIDEENEFTHLAWRPRSAPSTEPETDLIMLPTDGSFTPITKPNDIYTSPSNGRIFALKFSSSPDRHFFWLQSKNQHPNNKPNHWSDKDLKLGKIVNDLLQGNEVDVQEELASARRNNGNDDEDMEDAPPDNDLTRTSTGGAGAGATGGDIREEGEGARGGGADGGRANAPPANDAAAAVQNFLRSLGGQGAAGSGQSGAEQSVFTTLSDLMTPDICIATLADATPTYVDSLCSLLPPQILLLAQEADDLTDVDPTSETTSAAIEALTIEQKKDVLKRVFRSPQLHQSLGSLTMAIRDGGLPMVADSLKVKVKNGGLIRGGQMPLGEGQAVEAFLEGVKATVTEEDANDAGGSMDTS
ncbi:Mannosyl-oligosaccharide 1,2-alpha-mannosidase [Venturia inaequalis]|nr:Mannosyl-oligosaccharide 1,2-alpha-mannosidase [Venturia inaequalis]